MIRIAIAERQVRQHCHAIEKHEGSRSSDNARCEDFRRIFLEQLESIYQLSFLLTNDSDRAEQCLLNTLDECARSHHVFKEWALPWAKRTLVQNAIRALQPNIVRAEPCSPSIAFAHDKLTSCGAESFDIAAVLSLQAFERFVFVLSVLEGYSVRECVLLLGCLAEDVRKARIDAVEHLVAWSLSEHTARIASAGTQSQLSTTTQLRNIDETCHG